MTRILFLPDLLTVLMYETALPVHELAQLVNQGRWELPAGIDAPAMLRAAVLNGNTVAIVPVYPDETVHTAKAPDSLPPATRSPAIPEIQLTSREREILVYLARGLTAKQISRQLGIHRNTTDYHINKLKKRLGAHTLAQSMMVAIGLGLDKEPPDRSAGQTGCQT